MTTNRPILLVEDNPDDEALALRAFRKCNIRNPIQIAHDGAEALALLLNDNEQNPISRHNLPAVMLLDLNLPRVSGLEVLQQVRAEPDTRHLPIVILTSSKQDEDLLASYHLGANSYVRKPVDFDEFARAVSQLGMYWLLINELPY
ncbi:two-component system response regulator [Pokkaliibacter plantistimulans]|uniref:Two-component system response regulator n=1 Tax=Proteobacteria bacterium 228 TaxID=2083153 RepID=A0A2S5KTK3_9PROT|nr:response regulator [Pokkaliibacter plantistimulans]PPC78078.1 two-component system response regulator [Pokkaliibacter plantistimulans]